MIATLKFIQCKTIKRYGLGTLVDALYILYVDQPTVNNLIIYIIHHYCCYCCVVHELTIIGLLMDRLVQGKGIMVYWSFHRQLNLQIQLNLAQTLTNFHLNHRKSQASNMFYSILYNVCWCICRRSKTHFLIIYQIFSLFLLALRL